MSKHLPPERALRYYFAYAFALPLLAFWGGVAYTHILDGVPQWATPPVAILVGVVVGLLGQPLARVCLDLLRLGRVAQAFLALTKHIDQCPHCVVQLRDCADAHVRDIADATLPPFFSTKKASHDAH